MNPDLNQKEIPAGAEADALLALFLEEHGISLEVARSRVIPFVQNDEELLGAFHSAQLLDTSDEPFETKIAEQAYNTVAARGGGIVIIRSGYGLLDRGLDSWNCPPQLRAWPCTADKHGPMAPGCSCIYTNTTPQPSYHPHDDRDRIRNTPLLKKTTYDRLGRLERSIRESEGEAQQTAIDAKRRLEAEIEADVPRAQDRDEHAPKPKHHLRYKAALGAKGTLTQRREHIMKKHGGTELLKTLGIKRSDLSEPELHRLSELLNDTTLHYHYPDPAKYLIPPGDWGKVIDIHPTSLELLRAGVERVYFVIEGSIKALAVLTEILRTGERAAVVSVPSVTLWDVPQLNAFVREHLLGREVVIIYDADGYENLLVISQALMLQDRLCSLGVEHVAIAAPPLTAANEIDTHVHPVFGEVKCKGVDDYLALFDGTLDGLVVRDRITVDRAVALNAVRGRGFRADTVERHADILTTLPRYASHAPGDESGRPSRLVRSVKMFEKVTGISRRALANRRTYDTDGNLLEETAGYLALQHEVVRSFDLEEGDGFDAAAVYADDDGKAFGWDWENRPRITFKPEFRAREVAYMLSDWRSHRAAANNTHEPQITTSTEEVILRAE